MPRLLSGSTLRRGGSGEFLDLKGAMPQLPATETTLTGFTLVTDSVLRTSYRSSLGFVEFKNASIYSSLNDGQIRILATGTSFASTGTNSGTLVVGGGIGVNSNMFVRDDITVNDLLIGQGWEDPDYGGYNNIVIKGTALPKLNDFANGQENIVIGYDALQNIQLSNQSIAIGKNALSSGTGVTKSIAIGNNALRDVGTTPDWAKRPITGVQIIDSKPIVSATNTKPASIFVNGHGLTTGDRISIVDVVGWDRTGSSYHLVNDQSFFVNVVSPDVLQLFNNNFLTEETALDGRAGTATSYVSGGSIIYPIEITAPGNDYITGTAVLLQFTNGVEELHEQTVYARPLNSSTFQIYQDSAIRKGIDGTGMTPFVDNGTSTRVMYKVNNIAVGYNAGMSLFDGEQNFFMGDRIAENLTTGSYNFFLGHEVGNNIKVGSGNISIMGDTLIDNRDNQVGIGNIFYYNGLGYLQLNTDVGLGLGSTSTGGNSGALAVLGGVSISKNLIADEQVLFRSDISSVSKDTGALVVSGGVGIGESLFVEGSLNVTGSGDVVLSPTGADVYIRPTSGGTVQVFPNVVGELDNITIGYYIPQSGYFTNLYAKNETQSLGTDSGALIVSGGAGIAKDLWVGGTIHGIVAGNVDTATNLAGGSPGAVVYQANTGTTAFLPIGTSGTVLTSDGTNILWAESEGGHADTATTSTFANSVLVDSGVTTTDTYYVGLVSNINSYSGISSDVDLIYNTTTNRLSVTHLSVTGTTTSTSTTVNQALLVTGGVGFAEAIRARDGNPLEDNLLYTPKVTISTSAPINPRVGDFWINPTFGVELQWIKDGESSFWIQFTGF